MQPEDIPECVDIVANHPVLGPRYGPAIDHLAEAWVRLLQSEACITSVFHTGEGSDALICLFGVTVILGDDFLHEMKTPPHFWFGPELTRRMIEGKSPLLTDKLLREANSRDGLNGVVWEGCFRPEYEDHRELQRYMMSTFIQLHQGYLWKELIGSQSESLHHLDFALKTGGCLWDPQAGCYTTTLKRDLSEIFSAPHILGITRQSDWAGNWAGALFDYHPPMLGFSRSEQRLLSYALPGATDEQLAGMLGSSLPAIKKMWVSIYQRVEDYQPELIPDPLRPEIPTNGRGKEKRRRLLDYLREHPEELRPFSRSAAKFQRVAR
jgi:hypothetical protein